MNVKTQCPLQSRHRKSLAPSRKSHLLSGSSVPQRSALGELGRQARLVLSEVFAVIIEFPLKKSVCADELTELPLSSHLQPGFCTSPGLSGAQMSCWREGGLDRVSVIFPFPAVPRTVLGMGEAFHK